MDAGRGGLTFFDIEAGVSEMGVALMQPPLATLGNPHHLPRFGMLSIMAAIRPMIPLIIGTEIGEFGTIMLMHVPTDGAEFLGTLDQQCRRP